MMGVIPEVSYEWITGLGLFTMSLREHASPLHLYEALDIIGRLGLNDILEKYGGGTADTSVSSSCSAVQGEKSAED